MASRHAADPHRPFYSTPGPFYSTHGPFYSMPFLHHFSGFFLHHRSKLRFEMFFLEKIRKSRFVASEKPNKIRSRCLQNRTPKKRANVYRFLIAVACLLQKLTCHPTDGWAQRFQHFGHDFAKLHLFIFMYLHHLYCIVYHMQILNV